MTARRGWSRYRADQARVVLTALAETAVLLGIFLGLPGLLVFLAAATDRLP